MPCTPSMALTSLPSRSRSPQRTRGEAKHRSRTGRSVVALLSHCCKMMRFAQACSLFQFLSRRRRCWISCIGGTAGRPPFLCQIPASVECHSKVSSNDCGREGQAFSGELRRHAWEALLFQLLAWLRAASCSAPRLRLSAAKPCV